MSPKQFFKGISAILVFLAVTFMLGVSVWAQSRFKTLHVFKGTGAGGSTPVASLIFGAAGNLYGTTQAGGADGYGTVFELTPNSDGSWKESVLYSFTGGSDGANPVAGLIFDGVGNLYGTTEGGGNSVCESTFLGCGVVFKMTPNAGGTWTESVLHNFQYPDGLFPVAGLIFDTAGNLYGTDPFGGDGDADLGLVFELTPNSDGTWTESVLHNFLPNWGKLRVGGEPAAGLIFDAAGNLYGTTTGYVVRGASGSGVVFMLTPKPAGGWKYKVLWAFQANSGTHPYADLVLDASGNLYGTTKGGGAYGYGVVFKLTPRSKGLWNYRVVHAFQDKSGAYPNAGLVLDGAGNLYGMTSGDATKTIG